MSNQAHQQAQTKAWRPGVKSKLRMSDNMAELTKQNGGWLQNSAVGAQSSTQRPISRVMWWAEKEASRLVERVNCTSEGSKKLHESHHR